jgi:hypothetical protein
MCLIEDMVTSFEIPILRKRMPKNYHFLFWITGLKK